MKLGKFIIGILILSLISCKSNGQSHEAINNPILKKNPTEFENMKFPKPLGFVSDYSNILTKNQIAELETILTEYEKKTTNEIVIVTIDSIKPYTNIRLFSNDLANNWAIGKKDKHNGLIIVVCTHLRDLSISTGYGTEKILTDEICKKVIDFTMIPEFKSGNYYSGIEKGLNELIMQWNEK